MVERRIFIEILNFSEFWKIYDAAFDCDFPVDFLSYLYDSEHLNASNIAINIVKQIERIVSINFGFEIQFVTFRRGHPRTPIDPAPVLLSGKPCSTSHYANACLWFVGFLPSSRASVLDPH